jgi:uncharacterized protein (UPF0333 family)
MFKLQKKGQSTLEYVILIGFVVAALILMGVYMKRSIQGKLRESSDQIGEQFSAAHTKSNYITHSKLKQEETQTGGGVSVIKYITNNQSRSGSETVANFTVQDASGNWILND